MEINDNHIDSSYTRRAVIELMMSVGLPSFILLGPARLRSALFLLEVGDAEKRTVAVIDCVTLLKLSNTKLWHYIKCRNTHGGCGCG